MITQSTLGAKRTMLDAGGSHYVTIASHVGEVRVTISSTTHQLDAGLTASYETAGFAVFAESVNGTAVVVHDGDQPGDRGDFPRFPITNAIRLVEPSEAWLRSRMDARDWQPPAGFDAAMAHKRKDAAQRAQVEQEVREANARMQAASEPKRPPAAKPMTLEESQARSAAIHARQNAEVEDRSNRQEAATAGASDW